MTTSGGFDAVRSDAGSAAIPIDAFIDQTNERCRYVDNNGNASQSIFVPFKHPNEWDAFIKNPPGFTGLVHCSRMMTDAITPDSDPNDTLYCNSPSPASQPAVLPYARYPDPATNAPPQQTAQVTFTCQGSSGPWTETATAYYSGLDSDTVAVGQPSWTKVKTTYSSNQASNLCGAADGRFDIGHPSCPGANYYGLCAQGATASQITRSQGDVVVESDWTCTENNQVSPCVYFCEHMCGQYHC